MTRYVLVENVTDTVLKTVDGTREFRTGVPPMLNNKPMRWLKLVTINPAVNENQVKEGPTVDITATHYTKTWTVRNKTIRELDEEKNVQAVTTMQGLKALMTALNDGTFVPGQNLTNSQMKELIKDHL